MHIKNTEISGWGEKSTTKNTPAWDQFRRLTYIHYMFKCFHLLSRAMSIKILDWCYCRKKSVSQDHVEKIREILWRYIIFRKKKEFHNGSVIFVENFLTSDIEVMTHFKRHRNNIVKIDTLAAIILKIDYSLIYIHDRYKMGSSLEAYI